MIRKWNRIITAALCAAVFGRAWAQAPQFAVLDIEYENFVNYVNDVGDPSKLVTSPNVANATARNFMTNIFIGDIVSVNGRPAKGSIVLRGQFVMLVPNPVPGQAIADIPLQGALGEVYLEILQPDGTRVGTIMTMGGFGGAPAGAPPGYSGNTTVTGGTGAFLGARGFVLASPGGTVRTASTQEDPANRRINGGGRFNITVYLIPMSLPEIASTASGPAVFHSDFSPVTSSKPARSGETLIVTATGLGPTRPGLTPGTPFPDSPAQEVNSPLEVTVNGKSADVVNKFGWPGTTDTYRVDIRVPDGTAPGIAALQVTAAFIAGREMKIPVQ
jgi:hypothetical protein